MTAKWIVEDFANTEGRRPFRILLQYANINYESLNSGSGGEDRKDS